MSPAEQEDSLSTLEDRIQRAVQLVSKLRQEKEAAAGPPAPPPPARTEVARLTDEVKSLHNERKQVRSRIEKLLGQIDQLSAS
jgi:phage shock protein A